MSPTPDNHPELFEDGDFPSGSFDSIESTDYVEVTPDAGGDPFIPTILVEASKHGGEECANIYIEGFPSEEFKAGNLRVKEIKEKVLVARVTKLRLWMFPVNIRPDKVDYLQPKYGTLTTIMVDGMWQIPSDPDEFDYLLESLPTGFARHARYGLGLKWEYRLIPETIAEIDGVTDLLIALDDQATLAPPVYTLGTERFDQLRRCMDRIARDYQRESLVDRRLAAYDNLLHAVDKNTFPQRFKKIKPGALYELIRVGGNRQQRSREDQKAAVLLVKADTQEIAKTDTTELLELKSTIEQVTLDQLVTKFEAMLSKGLKEQKWQDFFKANPFILSLAFAYPVFMVQDQAHVGGSTLRGVGEKIADFLYAQHYTGNLALIEIKHPKTKLLSPSSFRVGLFRPHKELNEAVVQVLDQRLHLQTTFASKAHYDDNLKDVHPFAIHCIVIAGGTPPSRDENKSLELFRNATKDVIVITFDELLGKLKEIQLLMKGNTINTTKDGEAMQLLKKSL